MLFNHRRLSSDRAVTKKILELASGNKLWMNAYSSGLFPAEVPLSVDEDFLENAGAGEFCFVEDADIRPWVDRTQKIVLFCWNRKYPADLYFPADILNSRWKADSVCEFTGNSHDKIRMEVYVR
jgi:hypothetical protein